MSADGAAARPAVGWERLLALAGIYVVVAHLLPSPASVTAEQWRQVGVFFATVGGLMLQPLPGSQVTVNLGSQEPPYAQSWSRAHVS